MPIPDYESIMLPLLKFADDGNEHSVDDAEKFLAKYFDLTEEERRKPKPSGQEPLFLNRLRWARLFLKKAGLVTDPKISYYKITDKGKEVIKENLSSIDIKYLQKYSEFNNWYNKKSTTKTVIKVNHWKPIKTAKYFKECSKDLKKALLMAEHAYIEIRKRIVGDIKKAESIKKNAKNKTEINDANLELKKLYEKFSIEYDDWNSDIVLAFSKIDEAYAKKYRECASKEAFFDMLGATESPGRFLQYLDLGVDVKPIYDVIKNIVLASGQLSYNLDEHTGLLRFYVNYIPESKVTKNGIDYWIKTWKNYSTSQYAEITTIAFGLEALLDSDPNKYKDVINEHIEFLLSNQTKNGAFKLRDYQDVESTSYCVMALSRVLDYDHSALVKANSYLRKFINQKYEYGWKIFSTISLALISLGDGPKIPKSWLEIQQKNVSKQLRQKTTQFVQTSPNINNQDIFRKMTQMIEEATNEILIISPFIDMYSLLTDKATKNDKINIRILTKPLSEFNGDRKKFAKAAHDTLRSLSNVDISISNIIHSRMLISDSKKLLVSSADLTHAQLYDEFNSGLYTEEIDSVSEAIKFFNNSLVGAQKISKTE